MSSLFADTHNVVAILEKSDAAEADVTRLQVLVDKKKIVISEAVIREILQLDDADGVVCLPNEEIFAGLAQMGYEKPAKRTSWNKFSTAMASAIICLSKGQKFNFSKYIFDSLVRNVDSSSKFYMYPWFIQLIIQNQVGDLSTHTTRYISPALTQKENVAEDVTNEAIPSPTSHDIPSLSQEHTTPPQQPHISPPAPPEEAGDYQAMDKGKEQIKSSDDMEDVFNQGRMINDDEGIKLLKDADIADTEGRQAEKQAEIYNLDLDHSSKVLSMQEDDSEVQEVVEPSIPAAAPTVVAAYTRRRKGVIIKDPEEELSLKTPTKTPKVKDKGKGILVESSKPMKKKDQIELDAEYARKLHEEINKDHEEINKDIDWDAAMDHINQKSKNPQYIKRYQGMKKGPQTESEARKNMMIYLKNTTGYKMDFFKRMTYAEICPIFQARFDENMRFLFKSREEMEEEDQEIIKSINETPA
nr:hypothetical protein [Tanacetum cinerariifolium]